MGFGDGFAGFLATVICVVASPILVPLAVGSVIKDNIKESGERIGEEKAAARYREKMARITAALEEAKSRSLNSQSYFDLLVAFFALAMVTANSDGNISAEEEDSIREFIAGIGHSELPQHVKDVFIGLKTNPPTFQTAMQLVRKVGGVNLAQFEDVIQIVANCDNNFSENEQAVLQTFREEMQVA